MKYLPAVFVLISVFLGVRVLSSSIKYIGKIILNLLLGLPTVYTFNLVGRYIGITIDINLFCVLITALCGPAGLVVLLTVKLLMH